MYLVSMSFRNKNLMVKDHIEDINKAVRWTSAWLWSLYCVKLEAPMMDLDGRICYIPVLFFDKYKHVFQDAISPEEFDVRKLKKISWYLSNSDKIKFNYKKCLFRHGLLSYSDMMEVEEYEYEE